MRTRRPGKQVRAEEAERQNEPEGGAAVCACTCACARVCLRECPCTCACVHECAREYVAQRPVLTAFLRPPVTRTGRASEQSAPCWAAKHNRKLLCRHPGGGTAPAPGARRATSCRGGRVPRRLVGLCRPRPSPAGGTSGLCLRLPSASASSGGSLLPACALLTRTQASRAGPTPPTPS